MTNHPDSGLPAPAIIDMLTTLVGFNTTSYRTNLELIDFVYEYLNQHDVKALLDFNKEKTKANLYAVIGPRMGGGIALSGHTDVVPVDGQDWSTDPWALLENDGRLYGRGAADMKGFVAVVLAAIPRLSQIALRAPIHLCLSYDEEVGCLGVRSLLEYLSKQDNLPDACFVGEPTSMRTVNGHKGKLSMQCRVKGHACHSALAPQGVNAVDAAAKVITYLSGMAARKREEGPFDSDYDVPYTTIHTGTIHGGTQLNIVPEECKFEFEFRHLSEDDPHELLAAVQRFAHEKLEPAMRAVRPETGFSWEQLSNFPGLETDPDSELVALANRLLGKTGTSKVAFGTEGGGFSRIGISSVVCGPGSIEQAHKPDEFVSLAQLGECERFVAKLIQHVTPAAE